MSQHARLSPSDHRWPNCPGSVREEASYPDVAGDAAIDGTGSHVLLELCVTSSKPAVEYIGQTIGEGHEDRPQGWVVDADRAARVQIALDYVARRQTEEVFFQTQSEIQSNPGYWFGRDDWYGTSDIVLSGPEVLEVIDYKDGQGYVSEKNNPQMVAYAYGMLAPYLFHNKDMTAPAIGNCAIKRIRMTIIQPKTNNPIRCEEIGPAELYSRAKTLLEAAKGTDNPNAPLIEGPWCTWCKHGRAGNCSAKAEKAGNGFEVLQQLDTGSLIVSTMSSDQLADLMDVKPIIDKLFKQVEEEVDRRLTETPGSVPRYTIGTGRGSRDWSDDPEVVEKKLKGMRFKKEDIWVAKLITPAQAEKHEGLTDRQKANLQKMIVVKEGAKKVVRSNREENVVNEMTNNFQFNFM